MEDFNQPKICWASVGETSYSFIPPIYVLLDTNYFFSTKEYHFLLGILNSKLITWWINSEDTAIGGSGAYRHYKYNLEKLHIPKCEIPEKLKVKIEEIINGTNISDNSSIIDNFIFNIYNLSSAEIQFIESQ